MAEFKQLTDKAIQELRDMKAEIARLKRNTLNRPSVVETDPTAPEVYVIETDTEGVPSPSITGTGTGELDTDIEGRVGYADCNVYRQDSDGFLRQINKTVRVHNPFPGQTFGGLTGLAARDKWGRWYISSVMPETAYAVTRATIPARGLVVTELATLTADIDATATTIFVSSTGGMPIEQQFVIIVENENILVTLSGALSPLTVVERGTNDTPASFHASGTPVHRSRVSLGSGSAEVYKAVIQSDGKYDLEGTGQNITIYNPCTDSIDDDTLVSIKREPFSGLFIANTLCGFPLIPGGQGYGPSGTGTGSQGLGDGALTTCCPGATVPSVIYLQLSGSFSTLLDGLILEAVFDGIDTWTANAHISNAYMNPDLTITVQCVGSVPHWEITFWWSSQGIGSEVYYLRMNPSSVYPLSTSCDPFCLDGTGNPVNQNSGLIHQPLRIRAGCAISPVQTDTGTGTIGNPEPGCSIDDNCFGCGVGGTVNAWDFTLTGVTDAGCGASSCDQLNTTFTLEYIDNCVWASTAGVVCNGQTYYWVLYDAGGPDIRLDWCTDINDPANTAAGRYDFSNPFTCLGDNTSTGQSGFGGFCSVPASVTISPACTAVTGTGDPGTDLLWADNFTDTNGVLLSGHLPITPVTGTYLDEYNNLQIVSNALRMTSARNGWCYYNPGQTVTRTTISFNVNYALTGSEFVNWYVGVRCAESGVLRDGFALGVLVRPSSATLQIYKVFGGAATLVASKSVSVGLSTTYTMVVDNIASEVNISLYQGVTLIDTLSWVDTSYNTNTYNQLGGSTSIPVASAASPYMDSLTVQG